MLDDLLAFSVSPAEIMVRGTLMYWFLFLLFRFLLRRDIGTVGIGDFLPTVQLPGDRPGQRGGDRAAGRGGEAASGAPGV